MTDDESDFLTAILADPDDDAPRLVFADWLEERGDPRAEFIRVQCRSATLDQNDPEWLVLQRRIGQLLDTHRAEWLDSLTESLGDSRWGVIFERGFPHRLSLDCRYREFVPSRMLPPLPTLRELSLYGDVTAQIVVDLVRCPEAARLRRLWVGYSNLRVVGSEAIAESPYLAGLVHLDLGACRLHDEGLARIAASPALASLRSWSLTDNGLTDDGAEALAASPHLACLESVEFGHRSLGAEDGCGVTFDGYRRLAESTTLDSLQTIWEMSVSPADDLPDDREEWIEVTRSHGPSRRVRVVHRVESFW